MGSEPKRSNTLCPRSVINDNQPFSGWWNNKTKIAMRHFMENATKKNQQLWTGCIYIYTHNVTQWRVSHIHLDHMIPAAGTSSFPQFFAKLSSHRVQLPATGEPGRIVLLADGKCVSPSTETWNLMSTSKVWKWSTQRVASKYLVCVFVSRKSYTCPTFLRFCCSHCALGPAWKVSVRLENTPFKLMMFPLNNFHRGCSIAAWPSLPEGNENPRHRLSLVLHDFSSWEPCDLVWKDLERSGKLWEP